MGGMRSSASCPEQLKADGTAQEKREQCHEARCGDFCKEGTGAASFSRYAPRMLFTREIIIFFSCEKMPLSRYISK